jgi:Ser/Thr protein kinase RdoA (MazF antagonist)
VQGLLARWPDLGSGPPVVLGGGLRSLNLRFGDRVVRVALASDHDLGKEEALLRLLGGEIRVPRVLDVAPGALLLEHVPHEELPASVAAARAVGRAAARIHAHRFEQSGFLDAALGIPDPFPTAYEGLRAWADGMLAGRPGRRLGALADRVRRAWEGSDATLRAVCAAPVLVHADFKPANVKWLPAESDVLVLDWEFAWSGPALMDVGQFLRWGAPGPFVAALVRAYREAGGDLPDGWRRAGELLDLFHLLGLMDAEGDRPVRDADVLARVEATLRRG